MSSTLVTTPDFTANYPHLFEAKLNTLSKNMEFSVTALFKLGEDLSHLQAACDAALAKKFGANKAAWPKNLRTPFSDQGDKVRVDKVTGKEALPPGYVKGAMMCTFKSNQQPGVVDQNVQRVLDASKIYSGVILRAQVNAGAYDQGANKGVSLYLNNVQIVREGQPLGGRVAPEQAFSAVATSEDSSTDGLFN